MAHMSPATLHLVGIAERDVLPDRFVAALTLRSRLFASPQEAITATAAARARVLRDLGVALPGAEIRDAAIRTEAETKRVEVRTPKDTSDGPGSVTETRWEHLGYFGSCTLTVGDVAANAATVLAACAAHRDVERVRHVFELSRQRSRLVAHELECEAVADALQRAQGLAAAAGHSVVGVLAIGGAPSPSMPLGESVALYSERMEGPPDYGDLEDALGELRPEPEEMTAFVPITVAIEPRS